MRVLFCAVLLLAACGQSAPSVDTQTVEADLPLATELTGPVVIRGDPAWRMDIDPELGMSLGLEDSQTWAADYVPPRRTALGYRFANDDLTVELEVAPCTAEGLSYPMTAVVWPRGHALLNGCAAERWDMQLLALMPQIDACIAAAPEARHVSYAGPRDDGHFVRLWSANGGVDCSVNANRVAQISPRDDSVRIGAENEAIFVRGPGRNPGGECFEAPEVRSAEGELLGWMDDPHGC